MSYTSNDECRHGWGSLLGGGIVGYFLGAATGGNWFGNNRGPYFGNGYGVGAMTAAYDTGKLDAILDNQASFQRQNDTQHITQAVTGGDATILASLNSINRDNYALNIQNLFNQQTQFRNVDKEFCNTNGLIGADGNATRASIQAFKDEWQAARYNDLLQRLNAAETKLANVPLELAMTNLTQKVNEIQSNFIPGAVRSVPACPPQQANCNLCPCTNS